MQVTASCQAQTGSCVGKRGSLWHSVTLGQFSLFPRCCITWKGSLLSISWQLDLWIVETPRIPNLTPTQVTVEGKGEFIPAEISACRTASLTLLSPAGNEKLLKAVICAGLYPKVAKIRPSFSKKRKMWGFGLMLVCIQGVFYMA